MNADIPPADITYNKQEKTKNMALKSNLTNYRTGWTKDDDQQLGQIIVNVTAQGGSLRDAYKQAAREMSRSFEGVRTRAQFLRESNSTTARPWVDHGIRLVGTPNDGFTLKTLRVRARKTRDANVAPVPKWPIDGTITTLTINDVKLTGRPDDLMCLAPALCRAIVSDRNRWA